MFVGPYVQVPFYNRSLTYLSLILNSIHAYFEDWSVCVCARAEN